VICQKIVLNLEPLRCPVKISWDKEHY